MAYGFRRPRFPIAVRSLKSDEHRGKAQSEVQRALRSAGQYQAEKAAKTLNHCHNTMTGLLKWMEKTNGANETRWRAGESPNQRAAGSHAPRSNVSRIELPTSRGRASPCNGQWRRMDFHSLRGTLNTHMALAKVDPQLRHSGIKLTLDIYTDSTLLRVSEAIVVLRSFTEDATYFDISRHSAPPAGTTEC